MFFKLFRHEDNDYRNIAESEEHSADVTSTDITSTDETDDISGVIGGWESKAYYEFREDGTYGWYKSSQDLNDNYYSGTYSVIRGYEACEHLGITFDKIITVIVNSEGQITLDDIYCITCSPTYLVSGGVDKSDTLNGMSYEMLFVVTGEKSAQGKLISNYDTYYFTKIK
ncbi:hypothetical protein [Butyrivibrio sp. INlla16]|uniref:hypothetical protein n=1 Tax=Butyrivibrio sp. INlla16 TaxID=1520807 RepID=UPI00088CFCE1|nr:hypothetical protein [Butyrivibrio sp. INlla16]SDB13399.1 hypothetical protein SAMN02910263_00612 [Butyrivibrio sp. INlla16]